MSGYKINYLTAHNDILFVQENLAREFGLVTATESVMREKLAEKINHLINTDFAGLINILYRVDVSESLLKQVLRTNPDKNAGVLIGDLVIERLLKKSKNRAGFRSQPPTSDDEKW